MAVPKEVETARGWFFIAHRELLAAALCHHIPRTRAEVELPNGLVVQRLQPARVDTSPMLSAVSFQSRHRMNKSRELEWTDPPNTVGQALHRMGTALERLQKALKNTRDERYRWFRRVPEGETSWVVHIDQFGQHLDVEPRDRRGWYETWTLEPLVANALDSVRRATRATEEGPELAVDGWELSRVLAELSGLNTVLLAQLARGKSSALQHASSGGRARSESNTASRAVEETCRLRAQGKTYGEIALERGENRDTVARRCQRNRDLVKFYRNNPDAD